MNAVTKPYSRKVHYYETDQMGIVHHSNYVRWFEEARLDLMDQVGADYHYLEENGIIIPVLFCNCTYKKPVRFPQTFSIAAKIEEFTGVRFHVSYEIYVEGEAAPVVLGESGHCFANQNLVPVRIDKKFPDTFNILKSLIKMKK